MKTKLDGDYASKVKKGGMAAFAFDCKCFFRTISSVFNGNGVVEGGTGAKRTTPINPNDGKTLYTEDDYQLGDRK